MTTDDVVSMRFVWVCVFFLVCLLEGVGLGRPGLQDTLSEAVWFVRLDALGRWLILPLWTWLTWHWFLRPLTGPLFTWRDGVAITAGLVWALFLTVRR